MMSSSTKEKKSIFIELFGRTDVGRLREHNEDTFLVADLTTGDRTLRPKERRRILGAQGGIMAVCDGMGGASSGEVASQLAADTLFSEIMTPPPATEIGQVVDKLNRALQTANDRIMKAAQKDPTRRGMGTTCSVAVVMGDKLVTAQVGDSRVYLVRGDQIIQVTKDQSLLNQLLDTGQITEKDVPNFQHTNVILQALGVVETVVPEFRVTALRHKDRILVCSDGLTGPADDEHILATIKASPDLVSACRALTDLANENGGPDNITVVLAEVRGPGLPPTDPDAPVETQVLPEPARTEGTPA